MPYIHHWFFISSSSIHHQFFISSSSARHQYSFVFERAEKGGQSIEGSKEGWVLYNSCFQEEMLWSGLLHKVNTLREDRGIHQNTILKNVWPIVVFKEFTYSNFRRKKRLFAWRGGGGGLKTILQNSVWTFLGWVFPHLLSIASYAIFDCFMWYYHY